MQKVLILGVFCGVLVRIKVPCKMSFGANKTPVEVIKESAFGGTYFRDIYSGVM